MPRKKLKQTKRNQDHPKTPYLITCAFYCPLRHATELGNTGTPPAVASHDHYLLRNVNMYVSRLSDRSDNYTDRSHRSSSRVFHHMYKSTPLGPMKKTCPNKGEGRAYHPSTVGSAPMSKCISGISAGGAASCIGVGIRPPSRQPGLLGVDNGRLVR